MPDADYEMEAFILAEALSLTYRGWFRHPPVTALDKIQLAASPGEIVGILGPNGSGKTSLLNILAGSQRPNAGEVKVLGHHPTDRALIGDVGYQAEGPLPFPDFSAMEFLSYLGELVGMRRSLARVRADLWAERLGLDPSKRQPIGTYSTGMTRRLALAAALLSEPKVLLLDEPTSGLDPKGSLIVMDLLQELQKEGNCAILMASHHLQEVEQICTRIYLLDKGQCHAQGTLEDLLGTGDRSLVIRGLDDAGLATVESAVTAAGGEIVKIGREREHLFALFRKARP